jgi:hypothetical protein
MAWAQFGPNLAAAGLRSFWFLPVALLGGWLASRACLSRLADAVALLLLLQVPILALESWLNLLAARLQADPTPAADGVLLVALAADSTVTLLFAQIGWLGVAGFYGLLAW